MRVLFTSGLGILAEQRIHRWKMVTELYARLARSFHRLGHQIYFCVHPEAVTEHVPKHVLWEAEEHEHLSYILDRFSPDFVFTWNGSSPGDEVTASIAARHGATMVYSEQGWFPQATSIYFDMAGCNGKCSTRHKRLPPPTGTNKKKFREMRQKYISYTQQKWDDEFIIRPADVSKPIFVPLQDERDLNIIQDSPFKTMDDFLNHVSKTFPENQLLVRPHPKYPEPSLSRYPNAVLASPKESFFLQLKRCGFVVGINSTTLLESALLGYTVVSYGNGLGTGTGAFIDATPEMSSNVLADSVSSEDAEGLLFHLLCEKQLNRADLDAPETLMASDIFRDMVRLLAWNPISR